MGTSKKRAGKTNRVRAYAKRSERNAIKASGKLPDVLEKLNGWALIGSGVGFFFCGTKEEFKQAAPYIDASFLEEWRARQHGYELDYKRCAERLMMATDKKAIEENIKDMERFDKLVAINKKGADTYVPVAEREVVWAAEGMIGGGYRIKVEGSEISRTGTLKEWKDDEKEREKLWRRMRNSKYFKAPKEQEDVNEE